MSEIKVVKVKFVITNKEHRPKKPVPTVTSQASNVRYAQKDNIGRQKVDKQESELDFEKSSLRALRERESEWSGLTFEDDTAVTGLSRDWLVTCAEDSLYSRKKKQ